MKPSITLDDYLTQMQPHIKYAIHDGANQAKAAGRRGLSLSDDDLAQEARIILMHVYSRYSRKSADELGRIGTRSIRNRVQDLIRSIDTVRAGGVGDYFKRGRGRSAERETVAVTVDTLEIEEYDTDHSGTSADPAPSPLENVAVQQALARLIASLNVVEQRAVRSLFDPNEFKPVGLTGGDFTKLKNLVRQTIREAL